MASKIEISQIDSSFTQETLSGPVLSLVAVFPSSYFEISRMVFCRSKPLSNEYHWRMPYFMNQDRVMSSPVAKTFTRFENLSDPFEVCGINFASDSYNEENKLQLPTLPTHTRSSPIDETMCVLSEKILSKAYRFSQL